MRSPLPLKASAAIVAAMVVFTVQACGSQPADTADTADTAEDASTPAAQSEPADADSPGAADTADTAEDASTPAAQSEPADADSPGAADTADTAEDASTPAAQSEPADADSPGAADTESADSDAAMSTDEPSDAGTVEAGDESDPDAPEADDVGSDPDTGIDAADPSEQADAPDMRTPRAQITEQVEAYIFGEPPPGVSPQEMRCVSDSIVAAVSDERAAAVATDLQSIDLAEAGLPSAVFTTDETETIVEAAAECLDWGTVFADGLIGETAGLSQMSPPQCVTDASASDGFAQQAAHLAIFGEGAVPDAVFALYGQDCAAELITVSTVADMTAAGVSPESASCAAQRIVDSLMDTMQAEADGADPDETAMRLMMGSMAALSECLTEDEIGLLYSEEP